MPKRKKIDDDDVNIPEFNRDLALIEHSVKFNGIMVINRLYDLKNSRKGDGFNTRGDIEHMPWEIDKAKEFINKFLGKEYQDKTDDQWRIYITPEDIKSLETALDKLNNYKYPDIKKNEYRTVTNWEDIITELEEHLKPIFEEIRESYKKYLPEDERVIPFAPLENQEEEEQGEQEEEEETVYASVGGRRRKYRKKRTKKRRKSRRRKRTRKRRKSRRKSRRRKNLKKRTKRRR